MKKENLKKVGIEYPIKLEYYKLINEDEIVKNKKAKFGIKVIKTEYKKDKVKVESKKKQYVSNDENKIENILNLLKRNEVTPVIVDDVLDDFTKIW